MMRRQASVLLLVSMVSATVLPVFARAPGEREPSCAATSIVLPAGARYPNGIAHAADGTLYVGLVTSGRILSKPPGASGKPSSPAARRSSLPPRCGWTSRVACSGAIRRTSYPLAGAGRMGCSPWISRPVPCADI